ncbi:MAG: hypothetical protein ACLR8P_07375 [Clostridium fessum]
MKITAGSRHNLKGFTGTMVYSQFIRSHIEGGNYLHYLDDSDSGTSRRASGCVTGTLKRARSCGLIPICISGKYPADPVYPASDPPACWSG